MQTSYGACRRPTCVCRSQGERVLRLVEACRARRDDTARETGGVHAGTPVRSQRRAEPALGALRERPISPVGFVGKACCIGTGHASADNPTPAAGSSRVSRPTSVSAGTTDPAAHPRKRSAPLHFAAGRNASAPSSAGRTAPPRSRAYDARLVANRGAGVRAARRERSRLRDLSHGSRPGGSSSGARARAS